MIPLQDKSRRPTHFAIVTSAIIALPSADMNFRLPISNTIDRPNWGDARCDVGKNITLQSSGL